jgi:ribosomal protein S18 acetylase RimI-like enzyme
VTEACDLEYRPLSPDCATGAFSCGHDEIDQWFLKKAHNHHGQLRSRVTTVHATNGDLLAFFALRITLEDENLLVKTDPIRAFANRRQFPALHLEYLAVASAHQKQQIGTIVMGQILDKFHDAVVHLGVPVLTLVPVDDGTLAFYERLGFHHYAAHKGMRNMMLPGKTVLDMREKALAQTAEEAEA